MQKTAEEINELASGACIHGSTNIGKSNKAFDLWISLLDCFTRMNRLLNNTRQRDRIKKQDFNTLVDFFAKNGTLCTAFSDIYKSISIDNQYVNLNIAKLVDNPKVLSLVLKYCPIFFDNKVVATLKAEHLQATIALEMEQILKNAKKSREEESDKNIEFLLELALLNMYEAGEEFTGENLDQLITKAIDDVKNSVYTCGVGNCALMADTAFLWAIQKNIGVDINYLRIRCSEDERVDVINFVALGKWPESGCVLIVPWGGHGVIKWQGTIAETPELKNIHQSYNEIVKICTLTPEMQEKYRQQLDEQKFTSFGNNPMRQVMHDKIVSLSEKFLGQLQERLLPKQATTYASKIVKF